MTKRAAIIGYGKIGKEIEQQLIAQGWQITCVVNSKGTVKSSIPVVKEWVSDWDWLRAGVDIAFLAIPTTDDGFIAANYIHNLVARCVHVVTCEKGTLANHFGWVQSLLPFLGYSATAGGGSGMLNYLQQQFCADTQAVHTILNGTLNYMFTALEKGVSLDKVAKDVRQLGYAEPGAVDPIKLIMAEIAQDATKKAAVLFNLCFESDVIQARDIEVTLTEQMLDRAIVNARSRRFVVSFVRCDSFCDNPTDITAFCHMAGNWVIKGAFVLIDTPPIARLCSNVFGVNNGLLMVEGKNDVSVSHLCAGPGAGPEATASAMIRDAEKLLARRTI